MVNYNQGFGSGSGSGWIRDFFTSWIRIRIRDFFPDPDPDPGVAKMINFVTIIEDYLEV